DGIRDFHVTGVQTCALPISPDPLRPLGDGRAALAAGARGHDALVPEVLLGAVEDVGQGERPVLHESEHPGPPPATVLWVTGETRSEERRVGKEWRWRWAAGE